MVGATEDVRIETGETSVFAVLYVHRAATRHGSGALRNGDASHHLLASGGTVHGGQWCETAVGRGGVLDDEYGERWYLP